MIDLGEFYYTISDLGGLAKPNRYQVYIPAGSLVGKSTAIYNANAAQLEFSDDATDWVSDYYGGDTSGIAWELTALCERSELPSYQFQMETMRHYGPSFKFPHMPEYQDITMTFLCGNSMNERYFFDTWMYMVMDPVTNNFNYIDEYALDIDIVQYKDVATGGGIEPNYFTTLIDAYPIAINTQELGYENNNVAQKIQVTFTYKFAIPFNGKGSGNRQLRGNQQTFSQTITNTTAPTTQNTAP
jgi:hypothetical protein